MFDYSNRKINHIKPSLTAHCNLRHRYCIPTEGIKQLDHKDTLSFEEIYNITSCAVTPGIDKVRLTGREPLVKRGIVTIASMLRGIDGINDFAMTTNGPLLTDPTKPLKEAGLHRLNISLDSLSKQTYEKITRGNKNSGLQKSISGEKSKKNEFNLLGG